MNNLRRVSIILYTRFWAGNSTDVFHLSLGGGHNTVQFLLIPDEIVVRVLLIVQGSTNLSPVDQWSNKIFFSFPCRMRPWRIKMFLEPSFRGYPRGVTFIPFSFGFISCLKSVFISSTVTPNPFFIRLSQVELHVSHLQIRIVRQGLVYNRLQSGLCPLSLPWQSLVLLGLFVPSPMWFHDTYLFLY
jgi:hypothetical protein